MDHARDWATLAELSPADAADILEEVGETAAIELITALPLAERAQLMEELRDDLAVGLLNRLPRSEAALVLESMAANEAADLLSVVSEGRLDRLLEAMDQASAGEVEDLLVHDPESAGGLMTANIAALPVGLTVGEAVERIRGLHEQLEQLSYVYVVDDGQHLVGVVSFRDLVFHRPGDGLGEAMVHDPIAVDTTTDREEVAALVQRYHLFGIPVTDPSGVLMGMVPTEAVLEAVQEEASEDFAVAVGTTGEDSVYAPVRLSIKHRLPWITFDLALSFTVVLAISSFDEVITVFVVLAALMPLIARVGGDAGAQSLAVVIRGLATDGIPRSGVRRTIRRETTVGLANGLIIGVLAGLIGYGLETARSGVAPISVGIAVFCATWANLALSGFFGSSIPLVLRRFHLDPALGSNLFLTTFTDFLGFVGFLAVASALL